VQRPGAITPVAAPFIRPSSSPDLWNFELAHAGNEEIAKLRFESQPDVEHKKKIKTKYCKLL